MKRFAFAAAMIAAAPALAQQSESPGQRATEIMLNREIAAHQQDLGAAVQLQDQVATLTKQIADLTKERDALKVDAKSTTPATDATGK